MRRIATTIAVCAAVGAAGTAVAVACPPGQTPGGDPTSTTDTTSTTGTTSTTSVRDYSGTVTSVNAKAHKFGLRTDSGKKVTIKVKGSTDFGEGASSIRSLEKGDDADVTARKTSRGLVATDVGCPNKDSGDTTDTTEDTPAS